MTTTTTTQETTMDTTAPTLTRSICCQESISRPGHSGPWYCDNCHGEAFGSEARRARSIADNAPMGPAPRLCCHVRSCQACDRTGQPCGAHVVGQPGHERCTGRDPLPVVNIWAELADTPAPPAHLSSGEAQAWTAGYEAAKRS